MRSIAGRGYSSLPAPQAAVVLSVIQAVGFVVVALLAGAGARPGRAVPDRRAHGSGWSLGPRSAWPSPRLPSWPATAAWARRAPPSSCSLEPVVGVFLAAVLLAERPALVQLAGRGPGAGRQPARPGPPSAASGGAARRPERPMAPPGRAAASSRCARATLGSRVGDPTAPHSPDRAPSRPAHMEERCAFARQSSRPRAGARASCRPPRRSPRRCCRWSTSRSSSTRSRRPSRPASSRSSSSRAARSGPSRTTSTTASSWSRCSRRGATSRCCGACDASVTWPRSATCARRSSSGSGTPCSWPRSSSATSPSRSSSPTTW